MHYSSHTICFYCSHSLTGQNLPPGIQIVYRTDGKLLNLNRFMVKSNISTTSIMDFQYADDVIFSHSEQDLQCILDAFTNAHKLHSLALNIKQTQILNQPPPTIHIDNSFLENVDHFPYLGSHNSYKVDIYKEIRTSQICCASGPFAKLRRRAFEDCRSTKPLLFPPYLDHLQQPHQSP